MAFFSILRVLLAEQFGPKKKIKKYVTGIAEEFWTSEKCCRLLKSPSNNFHGRLVALPTIANLVWNSVLKNTPKFSATNET